ncbi:uncharacterized protein [Drosophila kikkawai]|uniref:Uncharacterized protein n=1 Tax=Drosophila kikkawai TaxID=30033 RepID=A0A6P4IPW6_DROKI|nr:uncharacterized protein LOC108076978 [Drosophila kikkawai]
MPPRKNKNQTQPVRRSERIRLRKEAAIAARNAELEQMGQERRAELASLRSGQSPSLNGVAAGSGVTPRSRPPRRNGAVTSTPLSKQAECLFDRFMDRILHAANECHSGKFSEGTRPNLNQEEQPTEAPRGWVSGQELRDEDVEVVEELDITISLLDSDSDLDFV